MATTAICTRNLTRDFGALHALDRLTFEVPAGIIYGLLGPKGAGKTTTILLLLGLLKPTAGEAEVLGYNIYHQIDAIRAQTGALLAQPGLYPHLSAEDNLTFYARIWHLSAQERWTRSRTLLTHLGLWRCRQERVEGWSLAQQRRLALARALLHRPALVLLDEPTAGLDAADARALRHSLLDLVRQEGTTVLLATASLTEAEQLCDRIGILHGGKLLGSTSPQDLRTHRRAVQVTIRGRGFDANLLALLRRRPEVGAVCLQDGELCIELLDPVDTAPLITLLIEAGAEVEEVSRREIGLEAILGWVAEAP